MATIEQGLGWNTAHIKTGAAQYRFVLVVVPFFHTCGDDFNESPSAGLVKGEGVEFIETTTRDGRYYHNFSLYLDTTGTPSDFEPSEISDVFSELPESKP